MNIYSLIANAGSLFCLILGIYVFYQDRRKLINRLFFLLSVTLTGFIFWANLAYDADAKEHVILIYYISVFFFGPFFAVNLHFNLIFTKHKLKMWQIALLYVPALIVIITTFTDYSLFSDFAREHGQWNFVPAYRSFGFWFYLLYTASYTIGAIIIIDIYRRRTGLNKEKRRAIIINSTYLISLLCGFLFAFTLPSFGIYHLSRMGPNTYVIYLFAIYYSVFRYKFLDLIPLIITDDIIAHISDMVILLDADFTITKINNKCTEILGFQNSSRDHKNIYSIIPEKEMFNERLNAFLKSNEKILNDSTYLKGSKAEILADVYVSRIYDRYCDIAGYLVIAKEIRGIKEFMKKYKLTAREFEVLRLLITGILNKEISEKLNVAESTIKSHIEHIYDKTGAGSKLELVNLLKRENFVL
jgi:DNA-binding CsgD family transcriptional regulator